MIPPPGPALLAACSALLAIVALRDLAASQPALSGAALGFGERMRRRIRWVPRSAALFGARDRLVRAGVAGRISTTALLLARSGSAFLGLLGGMAAAPAAPGRLGLLVLVGVPAAAFVAPDALLERSARLRRQRLVGALPDVLDRLAVSASTGRSAPAGFAEIASAGAGPLETELAVAVAEVSAGIPQASALEALRDRVGGAELAALVAAIERSRRYGSPLADQLRRQASSLRVEQRRSVQERAARAAPKIQLVVALVLVPSVLLMIAAGLIANAGALLGGV